MIKRQALYLVLALLLPMLVHAAPVAWQMIPEESQLSFTATQNNAPVSGQFKSFTTDLLVDLEQLNNSHVEIVVDINSLSASYADLKDTLMTADWFNTSLFPKAVFKASEFEKTGDHAWLAKGTLTIRDKSVPVTLTFTSRDITPNKCIVTGSTVIKRSAFGVGQGDWASTDEIKDDVTVNFTITAVTSA
ncbi:YceI family protein [Legionella sp. CNM-4043-24]|uniref:YceI family protein n=1 Tax=Legionella sp. CNM-4043-24 TaxID=3421646 RepID=UPI00403B0E10